MSKKKSALRDSLNQLREEAYMETKRWLTLFEEPKLNRPDFAPLLEKIAEEYYKECQSKVEACEEEWQSQPDAYMAEFPFKAETYYSGAYSSLLCDVLLCRHPGLAYQEKYAFWGTQAAMKKLVSENKSYADRLAHDAYLEYINQYEKNRKVIIDKLFADIEQHFKESVWKMKENLVAFKNMDGMIEKAKISKSTVYKEKLPRDKKLDDIVNVFVKSFKNVPGASFEIKRDMLKFSPFAYKLQCEAKEKPIDKWQLENRIHIGISRLEEILDGSGTATAKERIAIARALGHNQVYYEYYIYDTKTKVLNKEPRMCYSDEDINSYVDEKLFMESGDDYLSRFSESSSDSYKDEPCKPESNEYYCDKSISKEFRKALEEEEKMMEDFALILGSSEGKDTFSNWPDLDESDVPSV